MGFSVLQFFGFCIKKTLVFRFWCLLQFAASVLFRSKFSVFSKNKMRFQRICYSMRSGVFPVSLRKICTLTTSAECTSSLPILLHECIFSLDTKYMSVFA